MDSLSGSVPIYQQAKALGLVRSTLYFAIQKWTFQTAYSVTARNCQNLVAAKASVISKVGLADCSNFTQRFSCIEARKLP